MKRIVTTIALPLLALLLGFQSVLAQESDYQISTEFEERFHELRTSVNTATTVTEVDSLKKQIDSLRINYEDHQELLSVALYPITFEESIAQLESVANTAEHRLLIIENQNERVDTLMGEIATYESEIANLNQRVASLRNEITNSQNSEKELSGLVQNYRESLERRDQFILDVIDSLLIRYDDLKPSDVSELAEGAESGEVNEEDNPLLVFNSIIDDNLTVLKSTDQSLTTEDYLRMYVVQDRFEAVWNQIGDDIITIYVGDEGEEWKSNINSKLEDWRASAAKNMWDSLDNYVEEANIELEAFDDSESFYAALDNYVSNELEESEGSMFSSNLEQLENFDAFWSGKIKSDWSEYVHEGEVLTMQQISSIDKELVNWRDEAQPRSLLFPILLGLSLLIIVGLIVIIARKK